ncbi:MAG: DUF4954 family protein [Pirellulaceae bacterium]|nr:DUF4954 family protein [Pirellulaceae bacterium]
MYALARNPRKFQARDTRKTRTQKMEIDPLAPDTVEEIFQALRLLEIWTAKARLRADGRCPDDLDDEQLAQLGRELLTCSENRTAGLEVLGENMECSQRKVVILKTRQAHRAYREMLHYYAVKNLLDYLDSHHEANLVSMAQVLSGPRQRQWINVGGQLVSASDLEMLLGRIKSGELDSWDAIHEAYENIWNVYPRAKQKHAFATLLDLLAVKELTPALWQDALAESARIAEYIREQVYISRNKDYENPFRQATFANAEEMRAVIGTIDDNGFVKQTREDTKAFLDRIESAKARV